MSSPGDLNGVPVSAPEAPQDGLRERGSFIVFGRALGPSPFTDPGFAHHANSEFVDLSREYEYPLQYRNLKGLGLISAVGFGCLYIAGDANMLKQPETVLLVVVGFLALLFAGCFFCCVNCLHFLCAPASPPQLLSRTELRHLLGTTACTFWTILLLVAGGLKHFITAQPGERWLEEALFIIESFGAIVVLVPSWYLVNRFSKEPVKAGLIMSMFWAGAIFSAECAGIFNTLLLLIWTAADPDCNATMPVGPKWPMEAPSGGCVAKANLEWVLTPGIVEESFKFMVLLRLVTSLEEAMKSKALTRFPRMSTISCMPCCGWFLKFAASPAVVVLCGMAAGAGFGSLENVQYIAKLSGVVKATGSILPASVRIFTAMLHIAMTGTCSFFLAISLFSQRKRPFVKFIGWIMMVIGHGSYDAFCTFQAEMPVDECFTRVECYDDKQREVCVFSRTGKLAECSCKDGVDEETRKCASNSTAVLVESEGSKNQRTAGMGSEPARTLFPPASRTADPLALRAMQLGDLCYYHDSQNRQQQCCIWSVRLDGMCQIGSSRFDRPSTEHWIPTSRLVRLDSSPVGPVGAVEPLTKANVRAHTVASAGAPTVVSAATVINGDQRSRSPKSRAPFRERRCRVKVTVNDTVEEALKRAEFYGTVKSHFQEEGSLYVRFLHTNSAQKAVSTWKGAQWA